MEALRAPSIHFLLHFRFVLNRFFIIFLIFSENALRYAGSFIFRAKIRLPFTRADRLAEVASTKSFRKFGL